MGNMDASVNMVLRSLLLVFIVYGSQTTATSQPCELSEVQTCLGGATDLLPDIYFRPLDSNFLVMLRQELCNRGLETCLRHVSGNCSVSTLAPYGVVVGVANFLCHTDLNLDQSCISSPVVQHSFKLCFGLFKVLVDSLVTDPSLDKAGINKGMCIAYVDLSTCVAEATLDTCDARAQTFVTAFMNTITHPTRASIGCTVVS